MPKSSSTKKHLRGSSLMLAGRMVALLINLVTQTVIVRALTKEDYGSFAYVLSLLLLGSSLAKLSMDKALSRYVPIYFEKGDLPRTARVIMFVFMSNLLVGMTLVAGAVWLAPQLIQNALSLQLLTFMAILAPIEAMENGFQKLLAILAKPRSLMFRRHVLGPVLKLSAALPLLIYSGDVLLLGYCYLGARVLGTLVSFTMVRSELSKAGILPHLKQGPGEAKELLAFSLPLTTLDVSFALRTSLVTLVIEAFHGAVALATYRAVVPLSRLNLVVSDSFRLLFTPALARLHAQENQRQIETLYWSNATWIALLTYPVFVATFLFAEPLAVLLFEERYRGAAPILALLALATYTNSCFGFNSVTLQTLGKVRVVVTNGLISAIAAAIFLFTLIPMFGAIGGAVAVVLGQLLENSLNQWSLYRVHAVRRLPWCYARVYLCLMLSTALIGAAQFSGLSLLPNMAFASVIGLLVLRYCSHSLGAESIFPEVRRFAVLRWVLGIPKPAQQLVSVSAVTALLRERAASYYPEIKASLENVHLIEQQLRSNSEVYEFELTFAGEQRRHVIVKAPYSKRTVAMVSRPLEQDRPRITPRTDVETKGRHEFLALRSIDQHFSSLPNSPFGVIRMFDMYEDVSSAERNSEVLVMEKGPTCNLSHYLRRANRLQYRASRQGFPIHRAFRDSGAWLREFHQTDPLPHCEVRGATREDFLSTCDQFWDFLGARRQSHQDEITRLQAQFAAAVKNMPEHLPLGIVHGDYAPRNVLVAPDGRVTGFDTQGRWQAPIYEDIGHFLVALNASGLQVGTRGWAFSPRLLAELENEFLEGYFGESPPLVYVRLFECERLLEWWSSLLYVCETASGPRKWTKVTRATLWEPTIVQYLQRSVESAHDLTRQFTEAHEPASPAAASS